MVNIQLWFLWILFESILTSFSCFYVFGEINVKYFVLIPEIQSLFYLVFFVSFTLGNFQGSCYEWGLECLPKDSRIQTGFLRVTWLLGVILSSGLIHWRVQRWMWGPIRKGQSLGCDLGDVSSLSPPFSLDFCLPWYKQFALARSSHCCFWLGASWPSTGLWARSKPFSFQPLALWMLPSNRMVTEAVPPSMHCCFLLLLSNRPLTFHLCYCIFKAVKCPLGFALHLLFVF